MSDAVAYRNFAEFFKKATDFEPYPYQKRLAESHTPSVLDIPTGAGKTEAAILALWLWKRISNTDDTPRRLVYCLPMRVLAEQTKTRAEEWVRNLGLEKRINVQLFMGGSEDEMKNMRPDKEYIIIGTQDMLVSGALNRAYGNAPTVWPIIFGLLNNDCMWVMDEVQIMENALPTSIQLNHFRNEFGTYGSHKTVLMSATINPKWLYTVDSPQGSMSAYSLKESDENESLKKRNKAPKTLHKAPIALKKKYTKQDVRKLLGLHRGGTVTAIIVNTVERAQEIHRMLSKETDDCMLIHSRFRAGDRAELNRLISNIKERGECVIVSTQVLEAGVDISVQTMITEIAPWSSLVQRFGRCNRYGDLQDADVYWIDMMSDKVYPPYGKKEIESAKDKLEEHTDKSVSPADLPKIEDGKVFDSVLRRQDLINLFDTSPDLSGGHTDVSRFVRNMDQQLDVSVFWRDGADEQLKKRFMPERDEICNVSVSALKTFLQESKKYGYVCDYVEGVWEKINHSSIIPGQTIMMDSKTSGYSKTYGWDATSTDMVDVTDGSRKLDAYDGDSESESKKPVTLEDHTKHVLEEADLLLKSVGTVEGNIKDTVITSARYHDVGKAHSVFQDTMRRGITDENIKKDGKVWAKSQEGNLRHSIPGFRHEVASALSYLKQGDQLNNKQRDLVSYLIMSHHGKIRLSLRSFSRSDRQNADKEYVLGIKASGDELPAFSSSDVSVEKTPLDMSMARVGRSKSDEYSWTERVLRLLDMYGPFRISYLEALVRWADWSASNKEKGGECK